MIQPSYSQVRDSGKKPNHSNIYNVGNGFKLSQLPKQIVNYIVQRLNNMTDLVANNLRNPYYIHNRSTFDLTQDMTCLSRFTKDAISNQSTHPWIQKSSFQYDCFNIKSQKVKDLMGSMTQIQKEQTNPFDINIRIAPINQLNPFASFLSSQTSNLSFLSSKNDFFMDSMFKGGNLSSKSYQNQIKNQSYNQFNNYSVNQIEEDQSRYIDSHQNQRQSNDAPILSQSIFTDIDFYRFAQLPDYSKYSLWEEKEQDSQIIQSSLIYFPNQKQQISAINSSQQYNFQSRSIQVSEQELIIHLTLCLQMIQSKLFELDYEYMVWRIRPQINFSTPLYINGSINTYIRQILYLCNIRSKLDLVLEFIIVKQSNKQIYCKLLEVYSQSLRLLESILMMNLSHPITFFQFYQSLSPIKTQLHLLLTLLIKPQYLDEPFSEFRRQFLYNETEIFHQLMNKLSQVDYCDQEQKQLIRSLGLSCFSTILFSLNIFLHSNREEWEKSNNLQFYFGLLFEQRKQDVDKIIQKLNQINLDDLQIYSICKETLNMRITLNYSELCVYEIEWKNLFQKKRRSINKVAKRMQTQRRFKLQQIIQQKARQIQQMKKQLNQKLIMGMKLKSQSRQKQKQLIEIYKNQIQKKIQSKKLLKLIEIQEEKGYLLDKELKERDQLLNKKYQILAEHPQLIERKMKQIQEEIDLNQSRYRLQQQINPSFQHESPHSSINLVNPVNMPPLPPPRQQSPAVYHKSNSLNQNYRLNRQSSMRSSNRSHVGSVSENISVFFDDSEKQQSDIQMPHQDQLEIFKDVNMEVPIKIALDICIYNILKNQVDVLKLAYRTILYNKYRLSEIFSFLHKYILTSNGQHATNLLNQAVDGHSFFNINYLKDYFFSQNIKDQIQLIEPMFYRSDSNPMIGTLNLIQPTTQRSLQVVIGLKFHKLPQILSPIFNYVHMTRYMQIFSFCLRIRHCVYLIELQWKTLSTYQKLKSKRRQKIDKIFLKKLYSIRYKIQCFFNLFQTYFFIYVVEKQYKLLEQQVLRKQDIQNLPNYHLKFLDKIKIKGFIETKHDLAERFKKTFILVKQFHNIIGLFCGDDMDSYAKPDIEERLRRMERQFVELYKILQNSVG